MCVHSVKCCTQIIPIIYLSVHFHMATEFGKGKKEERKEDVKEEKRSFRKKGRKNEKKSWKERDKKTWTGLLF